jgi:hypothetical protein
MLPGQIDLIVVLFPPYHDLMVQSHHNRAFLALLVLVIPAVVARLFVGHIL